MFKTISAHRKTPACKYVRRAGARFKAVETGQNIQQLEKKLQDQSKLRFQHIKLAA